MKVLAATRSLQAAGLASLLLGLSGVAKVWATPAVHSPPLCVYFIDQIPPQGIGPAINGIDERRRGPIFKAAFEQAVKADKLPPAVFLNQDLSLPATVVSEPQAPAGARVLRIFLTKWSQTSIGGFADTEIQCRIYVEVLDNHKVTQKFGPFFARRRLDFVNANVPEDRWAQYQEAARDALEDMGRAFSPKIGR